MALLTRPSVVFAIVFGCFAVLVPRVFWPLIRGKPSLPQTDDNFRRPPAHVSRGENGDTVEHISGTPPHMRGAHPGMRMHHPGAAGERLQSASDHSSSKSVVTFALPMYTVGIGVFFIYTCIKYWSKRTNESKMPKYQSTGNIRWDSGRRKFQYSLEHNSDEEENEENKEELYAGLDPDYVEFLKLKKQKKIDAEQAMSDEQKEMHRTLDEMKKSLSFISTKLMTKENRGSLNNDEILQLQARLASTESQMCQILGALDAASSKVNELTKNTSQSLEQQSPPPMISEEQLHASESNSGSEEELSNSDDEDDDSGHQDEQVPINEKDEEEESSSSQEDEEERINPLEQNDEDSHSSSSSRQDDDRYGGLMETDFGRDPAIVDDFEIAKPTDSKPQEPDNKTKVDEWRERNHSQSLDSSHSSIEQDQQPPTTNNDEQNRVRKRRRR